MRGGRREERDIGERHGPTILVYHPTNEPLLVLLGTLYDEQRVAPPHHTDGIETDALADGLGYGEPFERLAHSEVFQLVIDKRDAIAVGSTPQTDEHIAHRLVAKLSAHHRLSLSRRLGILC